MQGLGQRAPSVVCGNVHNQFARLSLSLIRFSQQACSVPRSHSSCSSSSPFHQSPSRRRRLVPHFSLAPTCFVSRPEATRSTFSRSFTSIRDDRELIQDLYKTATKTFTPLTLNQMKVAGERFHAANPQQKEQQMIQSAEFLRTDLPIRVAKLTLDLMGLPFGLAEQPEVQHIIDTFLKTFKMWRDVPKVETGKDEEEFCAMVVKLLTRHQHTAFDLARGLSHQSLTRDEKLMVQPFLDRFHLNRIGNRMILSQYLALHGHRPGWVGCIQLEIYPEVLVEKIVGQVKKEIIRTSNVPDLVFPEVEFVGPKEPFTYVADHLEYILSEFIYRAIKATISFHRGAKVLPPVKIIYANPKKKYQHMTFKICDQGGGRKRASSGELWTQLVMDEQDVGDQPAATERVKEEQDTYAEPPDEKFDYYSSPILLNGPAYLCAVSYHCKHPVFGYLIP